MSGSSNQNAVPQCYVNICPFEGGNYTLTPSNSGLLAVRVLSTRASSGGGFELVFAPGGPNGPNADPSWSDIITPFSTVVIGMARGTYRRVVMIGVVRNAGEGYDRASDPVQRTVVVSGLDYSVFFNQMSYYNLNVLTGLNEGAAGSGSGLALLGRLNSNLLSGTPDAVGKAWLDLMVGTNGLLASTRIAYAGANYALSNVLSNWIQPFNGRVDIPTAANFLADEVTWTDKFLTFFPSPWYEFFVTTADVGFYPAATKAPSAIGLTGFAKAAPTVVARVMPLPSIDQGSGSFTLDMSLWQALPSFGPDSTSGAPLAFDLEFSAEDIHNFYILNPTVLSTLVGGGNSNLSAFALNYAAYIDVASIHRYGYRPLIAPLQWMADPAGIASRAAAANSNIGGFQQLVAQLILRLASFYQPTSLMANASCRLPLRPDIMPGSRFTANPRKTPVPWTFYIDSVSHEFQFGAAAVTTVALSRGLPASVYSDKALLTAVVSGAAQRVNGAIQAGVPASLGPTLAAFNTSTAPALVAATAGVFSLQNSGVSP